MTQLTFWRPIICEIILKIPTSQPTTRFGTTIISPLKVRVVHLQLLRNAVSCIVCVLFSSCCEANSSTLHTCDQNTQLFCKFPFTMCVWLHLKTVYAWNASSISSYFAQHHQLHNQPTDHPQSTHSVLPCAWQHSCDKRMDQQRKTTKYAFEIASEQCSCTCTLLFMCCGNVCMFS